MSTTIMNPNVFWGKDPNVLFSVPEFFPVPSMSQNRQLNAVTRLTVLLTLSMFICCRRPYVLFVGALTIASIWIVHYHRTQLMKEGFLNDDLATPEDVVGDFGYMDVRTSTNAQENPGGIEYTNVDNNPVQLDKTQYQAPTSSNPFGNVLPTDIVDNPTRLPAPPAYLPEVRDEITQKAKEMIANMHPEFPEMSAKLFGSLDNNLAFEQSLRQFTSNPVTTVPNDNSAFMAYCYGNTAGYKDSLNQ
jgi:hypothetical protein